MKQLAVFFIRMYQAMQASFYTGACRFHPTCSHYAIEAFETHGFFMGFALTAYRISRCQPFCKGGWDPVPRDPIHRATDIRDSIPRNLVPRVPFSSLKNFRSLS